MLPERRKSAEEIAKLRESMGVPGASPEAEAPPEASSLFEAPVEEELPPPPPPKPVSSLRKSEREPGGRKAPVRAAAAGAPIPVRRHSDKELAALRMQTVTPPDKSIQYIHHLAAPKPLVFAAYALCVAGAVAGWLGGWMPGLTPGNFPADWIEDLSRHPSFPKAGLILLIAACAGALALAGWIARKKPRSRHHAGFVTILAVLVLVFGIVYHHPDAETDEPAAVLAPTP